MAENIEGLLLTSANALGVRLMPAQTNAFQQYLTLLLSWNQKMNLTAITEPRQVCIKHFVDSLTVLDAIELGQFAKVLDVGSGAGFPGIPLKIAREDIQLTIIDSQQKRLNFLQAVLDKIHLSAELLHGRAEDLGREKKMRVKFDLVTARAVAPLNILCEYCMPFVKKNGCFVAMKGPNADEELAAAKNAIDVLGCELADVKKTMLMDGSSRTLLCFRRVKGFSMEYPRPSAKIAKKPL
ncbi:MAG: 16S rRNA (guanine(527)-N(7))-methyltransferase RsmG [Oscillospiraceae bacterium]|nr:16S rRNA (guanine(527)-N(7))-methyltransferase RsmG [Oscillospiraceae bacterium]